jgi:hypothetical protein
MCVFQFILSRRKGSYKPKYKMRNWTESRNSKGAVVVVLVALAVATDLT